MLIALVLQNRIPIDIRWDSETVSPQKLCGYMFLLDLLRMLNAAASPGTLPQGQNNPQKCKWDLYTESVNMI